MKKKIVAFKDRLIYFIASVLAISIAVIIFVYGRGFSSTDWMLEHWYLIVLFSFAFVIPLAGRIFFSYIIIENDHVYFHYFPWTFRWDKAANNIDARCNQEMLASEIVSIETVRLSKSERRTKVFYRHIKNRYLKVNLRYGNPKYVYVGNYSKTQISYIIGFLTNHTR